MPNMGPMGHIVVLAIALMVLGPKRLPEVGQSLGRCIREFKGSISAEHVARLFAHDVSRDEGCRCAPDDKQRCGVPLAWVVRAFFASCTDRV